MKPRTKFNKIELVWKKKDTQVHSVTLSRHFRGLWPWLFLECLHELLRTHHRMWQRRKAATGFLMDIMARFILALLC